MFAEQWCVWAACLCMHRYLQGAAHNVQADRHDEDAAGDSKQLKSAAAEAAQQLTPQALAVQLICRCDEIPDEGVEVLVLRGLLTASTSLTFTIHGQALLLAVRTCYNIHLMSRSEVNQTTAKAALTQMLNVVFQRMEAGSVRVAVSSPAPVLAAVRCFRYCTFAQQAAHQLLAHLLCVPAIKLLACSATIVGDGPLRCRCCLLLQMKPITVADMLGLYFNCCAL